MKNASARRSLLQWTFHRGGRYIVCQVTQTGEMFQLSWHALSPDSQPHQTVFASAVQAMQRHAEMARALRAAGWVVAAYTAPGIAGANRAAA